MSKKRDKLMTRIVKLKKKMICFRDKEETLIKEKSLYKQKIEIEEETRNKALSINKILIDDIKSKFEGQIQELKKVFQEKYLTENKIVQDKPKHIVKSANSKQFDNFILKKGDQNRGGINMFGRN